MSEPLYSLKRRRGWLWQTQYSRVQIVDLWQRGGLTGNWLVCPLGEPKRAIDLQLFVVDPAALHETEEAHPESGGRPNDGQATELDDSYVLLFGICLAIINFLAIPLALVAGPFFAMASTSLLTGVICAETGLVAAWFVFSSSRLQMRLLVSGAVGLVAYGLLFAGLIGQGPAAVTDVVAILVILAHLPAAFFAIQVPMWIARIWGRCAVIRPAEPLAGSYLHPIGVRELLIATGAVGSILGLLRAATLWASQYPGWSQEAFQIMLYIIVGAAVVSPFTITLLLLIVLGHTRARWGLAGVMAWSVAVAALAALLLAQSPGVAKLVVLGAIAVFAVVTCLGLVMVRMQGYRLVRIHHVTSDSQSRPS